MIENYLELVEIDSIEYQDEYVNMVDISIDKDESFSLSNGIISHNSAQSGAIAGLSVIGRDYYGSFPLKGKLLNIRDASPQKIKGNKEIQALLDIIGLQFGKEYTDLSELRYGKIIIFCDSDHDGIHIRGLILAFIEKMWSNLLKLGFVFEFITPILKVSKGKKSIPFYTHKEFEKWKSKGQKGWDIKYYKGLGTSTPKEMKEYFKDLDSHLLPMQWDTDKNHDYIDLVFNNKRADERKNWMMTTDIKDVVKFKTPTPISSFINNEMITFSLADNIRSIPDIYDGLKPSQRKILNTCLKRNIIKDTPVSSLGGSVKETQKYHHGECLDYDTEINLADGSKIKIGDWYTHYNEVDLIVKCVDKDGNSTIGVGKNPIQGKITDIEYEIEMENGETFKCTDNHKFLVGNEWITADKLEENMDIKDIS